MFGSFDGNIVNEQNTMSQEPLIATLVYSNNKCLDSYIAISISGGHFAKYRRDKTIVSAKSIVYFYCL